MKAKNNIRLSRRTVLRTAAAGLTVQAIDPGGLRAAPANGADHTTEVYTRIGAHPFITLTATSTVNGGGLTLPEVKSALDAASYHSINIDELMSKVSPRLAHLLGAEHAIVTSGAAAATMLATAACVAGADPENVRLLPHLAGTGFKDEVIMTSNARNPYDQAIRAVGVKIITVDTLEQIKNALSKQTALVALVGPHGITPPLEEIAQAAHQAQTHVLVDAAPEFPVVPNPYLSRGADLVAYSGGKVLMGPQCSGFLIGRKDLVQAAWVNSSPHDGLCRTMKVGKEEIMGALAAVEAFFARRDPAEEKRAWEAQLTQISDRISQVPGVRAKFVVSHSTNPHPILSIDWDPAKIDMTAGELRDALLEREPRLKIEVSGPANDGWNVDIHAAGIRPGQQQMVADRLYSEFARASQQKRPPLKPPSANLSGDWDLSIQFARASTEHRLTLKADGNRVTGWHFGKDAKGEIKGTLSGNQVRLRSQLPYVPTRLNYAFTGELDRGKMSGEVDMDQYGRAQWTAVRKA